MADMFRNTNPEAKGLSGIRRKRGVIDLVADWFHPRELKERTNVSDATGSEENGLPMVKQGIGDMIKNTGHATHAEEPEFR